MAEQRLTAAPGGLDRAGVHGEVRPGLIRSGQARQVDRVRLYRPELRGLAFAGVFGPLAVRERAGRVLQVVALDHEGQARADPRLDQLQEARGVLRVRAGVAGVEHGGPEAELVGRAHVVAEGLEEQPRRHRRQAPAIAPRL